MLFKNLIAAATLASTAFAAPAEKRQAANKLKFFGINESGAEFGEKNFTGVYGKEFIWYDLNTIDQFMNQGMNMFRLNFRKSAVSHRAPPKPTKSRSTQHTIELTITPSDGAPNSKLPNRRLRPPLPRQPDTTSQPHHSKGRLRHDPTTQLWTFPGKHHQRYRGLQNMVDKRSSSLQRQPARRIRYE